MTHSILIVEDDRAQSQMLNIILRRKLDMSALVANNGREALDILGSEEGKSIQVVLLDICMPILGGMETLDIIRKTYPHINVIMLTGSEDVSQSVAAMKAGAVDFITKPYEGERIAVSVRNALKLSTLHDEISRLARLRKADVEFADLVGHDTGLRQVVQIARRAAQSDIPVLITGETGTGKELFAHAIHGESQRGKAPFISINCGAIPEHLVESTLFGHEKGAFTGATEKTKGKFREADGGTIFLDEVGELPLNAQVKLLRALQQNEVEPVGAGRPIKVDVRVVSATNRDLQADVQNGLFREDLYFRLNVLNIDLPPLRARREDIFELTNHFIKRYCAAENRLPCQIDTHVMAHLTRQDWNGNVRELENYLRRMLALSDRSKITMDEIRMIEQISPLSAQSLQPISGQNQEDASKELPPSSLSLHDQNGRFLTVEQVEQALMKQAYDYFNGNITKAAQAIGMAKSSFYRKFRSE
jgi:DNA-binding NtrC family response regulator